MERKETTINIDLELFRSFMTQELNCLEIPEPTDQGHLEEILERQVGD